MPIRASPACVHLLRPDIPVPVRSYTPLVLEMLVCVLAVAFTPEPTQKLGTEQTRLLRSVQERLASLSTETKDKAGIHVPRIIVVGAQSVDRHGAVR